VPGVESATDANATVLLYELAHGHPGRWPEDLASLSPLVARQVALGRATGSAEYQRALALRAAFRQELIDTFESVDVLLHPTVAGPAPRAEERVSTRATTRRTAAWSLAGVPVLALPCGFAAGGLPLGLSLVGSPEDEWRLLAIGVAYQGLSAWHAAEPPNAAASRGDVAVKENARAGGAG
jgi:aspartyl-tRNA(Asn)/glutamyl-tRNA(Gln) amidotransferase subunit A